MPEPLPGAAVPGCDARVWPQVIRSGTLRTHPEDFVVTEELGFEPGGDGPHRFLRIRKTGCNTAWVARRLAELSGVRVADVGYSGLKDRNAVAEQWFSVPVAAQRPLRREDLAAEGIELIDETLNRRKLRTGSHRANGFRIVVRNVEAERDVLDARLAEIARDGVPNYFGRQRFGRDGNNLALAGAMARGRRLRRRDRGFALSAARSLIFNALLSKRIEAGTWNRLQPGDCAALAGTNSHFLVEEVDEALGDRLTRHDVHPTGVLWGLGTPTSRGEVRRLEMDVATAHGELKAVLERASVAQSRRPLRVSVEDLSWTIEDADLLLSFRLAAGGFATAVLAALA